jgi:hypothetical protein
VKYLNNVVEQDHRFIKKKVRASQCFKSFHTAERTLEGVEALNMMRKGQVKRLAGVDAMGQAEFVLDLFGTAAYRKLVNDVVRLNIIFATQPMAPESDNSPHRRSMSAGDPPPCLPDSG